MGGPVAVAVAVAVAVDVIISTGARCELFEWGIAVTLAPGYAEACNGQQGDMFDAQKDMAIAALGAAVGVAVALLVRRRRRRAVQVSAPAPAGR